MKIKKTYIMYILAIVIAVILSVFSLLGNQQPAISDQLGGDFSIPIENGEFHLKDYRHKVVLLYFGFASCPDVCPTALALTGNILKQLPKQLSEQIQPVFISVDPQRDDLAKLSLYGRYFHPKMISATDSSRNLDKLVRQYGAYYRINKQGDSAMDYTVDHTSRIYIIDKNGLLFETVDHGDIQANLRKTLLLLTE